ncbi:precorrin-3B synthase [Thioalkalivibrio nitratireducens DSM 14787]|uniref:Precorrin-3B synthase n=1 Tax=Thioalkalivibrio nitratireducens (strain DSM 14787 / UNIQEM 213 / ALEN2) TaxID=1255043 RepID=L0DV50_THIND|nr:hypothetical protein [Thioalkalivibrio nitratireducens]AGA32246.1 precorrin-3B synthase [Thioalkalivibrio nitratireducens DSM 14787]
MYKRPARLLVAALTDDGRARLVERFARRPVLAQWLEVRSAASMHRLDATDLEWADLLVAVDDAAARAFPRERPATCQLRRWRLPAAGVPGVEAAAASALNCIVGGMRMLARMDAAD